MLKRLVFVLFLHVGMKFHREEISLVIFWELDLSVALKETFVLGLPVELDYAVDWIPFPE